MKHSFALILLVAVGNCESNRLVCQIFDSSKRSLEKYCNNYNRKLPENCTNDINVQSSNSPNSSQASQLKIGGCDPEIVFDSVKRFQKNLHLLDISGSGYRNLDWFNLTLDQLQIFNASHNELSDSRLSFEAIKLPEIIEIDLSYNKLSVVNLDLREFPKLQKVHLSHNVFENAVTINIFPRSVEYIDLQHNQIKFMLYGAHEQYENLKELHLEKNPHFTMDCGSLEKMFHKRAGSLFLSWKEVRKFFGSCQENRFRILPINDTSEGIFIMSNGAYEMRCSDKCFENVYSFYAGYNSFQNLNDVIQNIGSDVIDINLNGNFIGKLSASAFDRFTIMQTLELSETNLTWFDFDMLRKQKDSIRHVDISNNNLRNLHNIPSLGNYYKLRELILAGNQIENAYEIIKFLNPSIEYLDLSGGNFVEKVNETTFRGLRLKWLNLSNTNLILPDSNPFATIQNLEVLDLSHNNLESYNFSIISVTLYNLTELNLADCKIKDIFVFETVIQYLGPNLTKLDLSENAAHGSINSLNFDLNLLKNQRELKFLDISNNNLKTVDFKSFPFDRYILINLEGNDLSELKNLQKRHSEWRWAKLKLANNQFPCHYLKQLKKDFDTEIDLVGDSWQQKPERDCRTATESINDFLTSVYDTIKFW